MAEKEAQKSSPTCTSGRICYFEIACCKQRNRTKLKDAACLDLRFHWPSVTGDTAPAAPLNLPIPSQNPSQEVVADRLDITPRWQDLVPYDPTSSEVFPSLPEAWRKDRKQAAALGYSTMGQTRTQRNALQRNSRKRHSVPPRYSEEVRLNTTDDPTMLHESMQSSWAPKSTCLDSCYSPSQGLTPAEDSWWHGEEFVAASTTNLPVPGAEHHFFHQY
ncbi:MAG: hypothetical protein Q9186_004749 [Xanthomendoza sp. 1 TL-2023]